GNGADGLGDADVQPPHAHGRRVRRGGVGRGGVEGERAGVEPAGDVGVGVAAGVGLDVGDRDLRAADGDAGRLGGRRVARLRRGERGRAVNAEVLERGRPARVEVGGGRGGRLGALGQAAAAGGPDARQRGGWGGAGGRGRGGRPRARREVGG